MALTDIVLRSVSNPPLTTKGSSLTFTELDDNFVEIYNYLLSLNNGGDIPIYDNSTTYSNGNVVQYGNIIYLYVNGTPASGQNPVANPTYWIETNLGAVAHVHNTDTKLAEGTADEVTAAELASLVNEQLFTKTTTQFNTLLINSQLITNRIYKISDFHPAGFLYVRAIENNKISGMGYLMLYVPDTTAINGVWSPAATPALNDYYSHDNRVYRNTTGTNTSTPPPSDTTNWAIQAYTSNKYKLKLYDATIRLDSGNALSIVNFYDVENKNYFTENDLQTYPTIFTGVVQINNVCDNISAIGKLCRGQNTITFNSFISSGVDNPIALDGSISSCSFIYSQLNLGDYANALSITNCTFQNVNLTFPYGTTSASDFSACSIHLPKFLQLSVRETGFSYIGCSIDASGSTFEDFIDITGNTTLYLDANGVSDIYGIFTLNSSNSSETIDKIQGYSFIPSDAPFHLIIRPANGLQLNITVAPAASATSDDIIGNNATSFILYGSNGDYMVVKRINLQSAGVDCWQITNVVIN
jgi:hypothetical protein